MKINFGFVFLNKFLCFLNRTDISFRFVFMDRHDPWLCQKFADSEKCRAFLEQEIQGISMFLSMIRIPGILTFTIIFLRLKCQNAKHPQKPVVFGTQQNRRFCVQKIPGIFMHQKFADKFLSVLSTVKNRKFLMS